MCCRSLVLFSVVLTRERDKEVRELSIARAELVRQQELTASQCAKLAHDKKLLRGDSKRMRKSLSSAKGVMALEKKMSFLVLLRVPCFNTGFDNSCAILGFAGETCKAQEGKGIIESRVETNDTKTYESCCKTAKKNMKRWESSLCRY